GKLAWQGEEARLNVSEAAGECLFESGRRRTRSVGGSHSAMADKPKEYRPPDPAKIDAQNPDALRFWARTLETPEDKIRAAVRKVGPMLEKVKQELGIGGPG